jgi:hypothetical protein
MSGTSFNASSVRFFEIKLVYISEAAMYIIDERQ